MQKTKVKSPIKFPGGKSSIANQIVDLFPSHITYVEPYFGSGAVLFNRDPTRDWAAKKPGQKLAAKDKGCSEIVNDLWGDLQNFWNVLRDKQQFPEFLGKIQLTPCSEITFREARGVLESQQKDPVKRALAFFVVCRQSRSANCRGFTPLATTRTRRGVNELVSAWWGAIEGLPEVHARLKNVIILNREATNVIRQYDGLGTLYYIDAPYVHSTRSTTTHYVHEMSDDQHQELLELLGGIEGKFILSGYRCPMYEAAERRHGWRRIEIEKRVQMAGGKTKRRRVECLWLNY